MKGTRLIISGIVCLALILIALPIWSGCRQSEPVYIKPSGEPVNLVNNSAARDHPWQVVSDFLERDTTDQERYTLEGGSAYFAEMLHNRAEYYGFKAAFVVVEFESGETHALNAFNTVDYGLVYVDCTGRGAWDRAAPPDIVLDYELPKENDLDIVLFKLRFSGTTVEFPSHTSWDKVAFVEEGEKLGFVGINCDTLVLDYEWYRVNKQLYERDVLWEDLRKRVAAHQEKVEAWFKEKGVRMHHLDWRIDEECSSLLEERENFEGLLASWVPEFFHSLGACWHWKESDSVVAAVRIYW